MSDNSSEKSLAKSDTSTDLNSKYSRLAAEYSKMRAQNAVLKKAVVDEQAKNNEINELLRAKNQIIRKVDQEMEALKFRNSQLTVRISVLQEELDSQNNKSNKKKSQNSEISNDTVGSGILGAEIEKTMLEHAKLISELSRKDEAHEEEVKTLKSEINRLNYELEQKSIKLRKVIEEHQMEMDQLRREQQDMKREYASKIVKLKETELELSTLKKVHKTYVEENGPKLEALVQLLPRKIPFFDEENESLNRLNVRFSTSVHDEDAFMKQLHKDFASLLLSFYNIVHNVTLELKEFGLDELKMYIKTLIRSDDGALTYEKLNACYPLFNNVGLELNDQNSIQKDINEFIKAFLDFAMSVQSSYTNRHHSINRDTSATYQVDVPVKVALEIFQLKKNEFVAKIITLPDSQHSIIHEEFDHFNEAIRNLIAAIDLTERNRQKACSSRVERNEEFKRKAIAYLNSLKKEPTEHIPYEETLKNKIKLQEYEILNNSLKQEIKSLEKVITTLEKENIRGLDEFAVEKDTSIHNDIVLSNSKNSAIQEKNNQLGKFLSACELPVEILEREKNILRHMNHKLSAIVTEKQEALSKARHYILECKTLGRRLDYSVTEKQLLEQKYLKSRQTSSELKEEMNTISQNYESHLRVMSEHLANVNEKLATQSEEIDKLRYQLNNKITKKNKSK